LGQLRQHGLPLLGEKLGRDQLVLAFSVTLVGDLYDRLGALRPLSRFSARVSRFGQAIERCE